VDQAIFAAGCFWGVQYYLDQIPGVQESAVGYTGGETENPTYEEVCSGTTGHAEAVWVEFDPGKVDFETLVRHFFRLHDPTQLNRQGPDVGSNYRSAIFYLNEPQRKVAEQVRDELQTAHKDPIVTEIEPAGPFYRAEDYHQKYTERTGQGKCDVEYQPLG
jgi:methionine-S-sulfoxide reductase